MRTRGQMMLLGVAAGLALAFAWPLGSAGAPGASAQSAPADATVTLTATASQASYAAGEPVDITLTLTNNGSAPLSLSSVPNGSISVVALTVDGAAVATRSVTFSSFPDLGTLLVANLQPVAPGGSATIDWQSDTDDDLGGQALEADVYDPSNLNQATLYSVAQPGSYDLIVQYRYPGPQDAGMTAFQGATEQVDVTFTVTP